MESAMRVTLAGPVPGERWVSIERYVQAIAAGAGEGLEVRIARAPVLDDRGRFAGYRARYRRYPELLARDSRADVAHIADQALGHLVDAVAFLPTVVTCHDLMPLVLEGHYSTSFQRWFDLTLLRRSLAAMTRATRLIAVSRHTVGDMERELGIDPERVSVVPNMLANEYEPRADAEAWLRDRGVVLPAGPRVLSVGHTRPYKNVEALLAAFAHWELHGAWLVRVGTALTPEQRAIAARSGLEGRILELGHREPPELARIYSACDVLVQPSRHEGFGLPVIEAMACGLPVVTSDGGALPEVAAEAGLIVPVPDAGNQESTRRLAEAISRVLSQPEFASILSRNGLERAKAFRPDAVVPQLVAAYRTAIEEGAS